jgi:glycopeptide antibiotics resistance protein
MFTFFAMPDQKSRDSRMWLKLWLIWIVVILGLTTMPWMNFVGHSHWDQVRWIPFYDHPLAMSDILANVVLFVPFGFFLGRALPGASPKRVWTLTLLLSAALSTSVEFFQVYCHNRIPSITDICTNLLGAVFGVLLSTPH